MVLASPGGGWLHRESLGAFYSSPFLRQFPGHLRYHEFDYAVYSGFVFVPTRFSRMPLGDCTAIFFSSPAFTMVLSFIILKWVKKSGWSIWHFISRDHCGLLRVLIAAILLTGVRFLSTYLPTLSPTSGVDLVPTSCPLPKPSSPLSQCLSQLFEVELNPALEWLWSSTF